MFGSDVFESDTLGALAKIPRTTSSGRTIASTWKYGSAIYYKTVRDSKGVVERGKVVGTGTQPIDYV